jgi:hypothetical protein
MCVKSGYIQCEVLSVHDFSCGDAKCSVDATFSGQMCGGREKASLNSRAGDGGAIFTQVVLSKRIWLSAKMVSDRFRLAKRCSESER